MNDANAAQSIFSIRQAAVLLGVSDDTVRRWADSGRLPVSKDGGRQTVAGLDLIPLLQEHAAAIDTEFEHAQASARNRFTGVVTRVQQDGVMAQVDLQAGPFRVVSLISREAADELGLAPGVLASATVKATNVAIELVKGT